jgi:SNF2 family DNA or RNA helicase
LLRLYHVLFSTSDDTYEEPLLEASDESVQRCLQEVDLGVEEESSMDYDSASSALGFSNGLPFIFNRFRHKAGLNLWDNPDAFNPESPNFEQEKLLAAALHWHQIVGTHSICRTIFSQKPSDEKSNARGMLIADEVGLGKTALVIAVLATLSHLVWLQKNNRPLPPLFRKYFVSDFIAYY